MKLADLDVLVVGNPPPGFGGRYFTFVKLTTDDGITGWGEVYAATVGPDAMRAVIADVFARHMAGEAHGGRVREVLDFILGPSDRSFLAPHQ